MKYTKERPTAVFDIETYRNYFLAMFQCVETRRRSTFEMYPGKELDRERLLSLLRRWRVVSFNGNSYDIPILSYALSGASNSELKQASDTIILTNLRPWHFYEQYGCGAPEFLDHIDLIEVAPGMASLKMYGARMHSKRLQDLPIEPDATITPEQRGALRMYCGNDLDTTVDLLTELRPQMALRESMSEQYGMDLRSRSDAQIAETIIRTELEKTTRRRLYRPDIKPGLFSYQPPEYLEFRTEHLRKTFNRVRRARFVVRRDGRVEMPDELNNYAVHIGSSVYRMGIGGLHSSESSVSHYSDDDHLIVDADVGAYYPSLIITNQFMPRSLGRNFLDVYSGIYHRRMKAKVEKNKAVDQTLKIALNGSYGKLGSPYSILYSPDLMIQVTITGQLALLMLIERLELYGIPVISANTDGIVAKVPRTLLGTYHAVLFDWECDTGLSLETTEYRALHSRDVNNYLAITASGQVKRKGAFAASGRGIPGGFGLAKNPQAEVCVDAAIEYLMNRTPVEDSIERCADIRKFLMVRQVRGGAAIDPTTLPHLEYLGLSDEEQSIVSDVWAPIELGRVVRWYYAKGVRGGIHYKTNGNTVPRSEGAMPCMELPDELPEDIDYDWYVREAYGILKDIGAPFECPDYSGRSGEVYARLQDRKTIHRLDVSSGVALCGAENSGPRSPWIEFDEMPDGHRLCAKCRREGEL